MHERPTWWQPDDGARPNYGQSGRRDFTDRRRDDRPYWWNEDDLPERNDRIRYDADRDEDDSRERYMRDRERHHMDRGDDGGDYERGRSRMGDKMKAFFGNDRAERRLAHDRRHHHDDHRPNETRTRDRDDRDRGFGGVGPRTRHEEDDELCEQLCQRLTDDARLDASDILVRVIDNEAILDGAVRNKHDAQRAYDIAHDIPGIVYVRDRIEVLGRHGRNRRRRATSGMGYEGNTRRWS